MVSLFTHKPNPSVTDRRACLAFVCGSLFIGSGVAQTANRLITSMRDLAEIKAECQRFAKLYIERATGRDSERLNRRLSRTLVELEEYSHHSPNWIQAGIAVEKSNALVADVRQILGLAGNGKTNEINTVVTVADRCSNDAEALMREIRGGAAGSRAIALTARSMYLSQRAVRDALLMANGIKTPGVSQDAVNKEREELAAVLRDISALPSTPGMKASLELVNHQWALIRPALVRSASSTEAMDQALRASERMFEALDELFDEVVKAALAFS